MPLGFTAEGSAPPPCKALSCHHLRSPLGHWGSTPYGLAASYSAPDLIEYSRSPFLVPNLSQSSASDLADIKRAEQGGLFPLHGDVGLVLAFRAAARLSRGRTGTFLTK